MEGDRRASAQTVIAVSTIISIFVGSFSLLSVIQSAERRTTVMEVKLEIVSKQIDRMEAIINANQADRREKEETKKKN